MTPDPFLLRQLTQGLGVEAVGERGIGGGDSGPSLLVPLDSGGIGA